MPVLVAQGFGHHNTAFNNVIDHICLIVQFDVFFGRKILQSFMQVIRKSWLPILRDPRIYAHATVLVAAAVPIIINQTGITERRPPGNSGQMCTAMGKQRLGIIQQNSKNPETANILTKFP